MQERGNEPQAKT